MSEEEIKDMLLKQCLELTTNNDLRPPISAYNGVDIDDVVSACKQLQDKKTYIDLVKENELLKKENQKYKEVIDKLKEWIYKEWINIVQQNKDNKHLEPFISIDELDELLDILKEVSE